MLRRTRSRKDGAHELDRRLGEGAKGVTVTAFDPGLMPGSGLVRDYSPAQRFVWRFIGPMLRLLPNVNSTRTSGSRLAALAVDPAFEGVTGRLERRREGRRPMTDQRAIGATHHGVTAPPTG